MIHVYVYCITTVQTSDSGVTILLLTAGRTTSIHNFAHPIHTAASNMRVIALFNSIIGTDRLTDQWTNGQTKPLIELRVRN